MKKLSIASALVASLLMSTSTIAGKWVQFEKKISEADAIVEVNLSIEKTNSNTVSHFTLKRVIANKTSSQIRLPESLFFFPAKSACWHRLWHEGSINVVVFLRQKELGTAESDIGNTFEQGSLGVELGNGALTSLNPSYNQMITALAGNASTNNPYAALLNTKNGERPIALISRHCE